jgi:hypothetical protein
VTLTASVDSGKAGMTRGSVDPVTSTSIVGSGKNIVSAGMRGPSSD